MRLAHRILTSQSEQYQPVDNQNWPKHRDIEDREPGAEKTDGDGSRGRIPELELGKTSNEWPELLVLLCRQFTGGAILHVIIHRFIGGVELRLKEGEEEVQEVDAKRVCDYNIPSASSTLRFKR